MSLLLFVPAALHYWHAWVYLSISTGASVLTTLYLMRKDAGLAWASDEGQSDGGAARWTSLLAAWPILGGAPHFRREPRFSELKGTHESLEAKESDGSISMKHQCREFALRDFIWRNSFMRWLEDWKPQSRS